MTRWGQFVLAQLTGRCSLRDIVSNLAAHQLYHLGVGDAVFARVNAEKSWEMYVSDCWGAAKRRRRHGYRFKAKLFSVGIDLCVGVSVGEVPRTKGACTSAWTTRGICRRSFG